MKRYSQIKTVSGKSTTDFVLIFLSPLYIKQTEVCNVILKTLFPINKCFKPFNSLNFVNFN